MNKPAKDFTREERGKCKYVYYRKKVFWDKVAEMVRGGFDSITACNKVYELYGENISVTKSLTQMRKDRMAEANPGVRLASL